MPNDKKITRADTVTIPSFVLPRGDARNKEETQKAVAAFFAPRRSAKPVASVYPALDAVNGMRRPGFAEIYSDGRRNYSSLEAMQRANPNMRVITNPSPGTFQRNKRSGPGADPGDRAERLGKALEYSRYAHDAFEAIAEAGGGKMAKKALGRIGKALDWAGAGARYTASRQRGEPVDVAVVRAAAPVAGSALGGVGGGFAGTIGGGAVGSAIPLLGTATGAAAGGMFGRAAGSYYGGEYGEDAADTYAGARRYLRW